MAKRRARKSVLGKKIALAAEFFDAVPIGIALRDTQGKYLFVNRTWEQYIGYRREEIVGTSLYTRLPREQADRILAMDRAALQAKPDTPPQPESLVWKERTFTQTRTVMRDPKGRVIGILIASVDTTDRGLQEQKLRDQVALTEAIVRQIPNAIFVKDPHGRYTMVNRGWSEMSGIPASEILGRTARDIYPPATAEKFESEDRRLLEAGAAAEPLEDIHQGPRNEEQWRIVRKAVLSREDGTVLGLVCTSTDISQLKRVEAELRDQMTLTRLLIEENPNAMFLKDTQGRYVTVNDAWLDMVGVTREQAIGRTVLELFPERESQRYHDEDMRLIAAGGGASEMESRRTGPDGKPQWVIIRKNVLRRSDGMVAGLVGTNTDITRLKQYEQALEDKTKFIGDVVEALPISVAMRDTEGRYVLVNRTWERYFGVRREDALGKRRREFPGWTRDASRLNDIDEIERIDQALLSGTYEDQGEEVHRQGRYYVIRRTLITDAAGKAVGVLSAGLDTTERHAMEQALKDSVRLREEVERMSRHDLKTPLNSVIAVSRLLREGLRLEAEDRELLGIVERAGYRILNMVNLSLDLFRMEQASYTFRPQAVDLAALARKVIADLEGQAASKNVAIRVVQPAPALARAEELLCYSMLANLIKNAVEAEPEDGIVTVTLEASGEHAFARVHNSGEVSPEVRLRFFDKYATAGKSAGLGLGTYSARLMARVQEGDITLETSAQAGTTVSVRLGVSRVAPADLPRQESDEEKAAPALPAARVLVVDDDEFNRLVLRRTLPSPPLKVALAVNGRAALQYVKRHWPDFVFLDLEMPVMDGYETARRLREVQKAEGRPHCTIVAISSNDDEATVQRALAAGCDRYLVKPAPREALWRLLSGFEGPREYPPQQEAGASDPVIVSAKLHAEVPAFLASRREMLAEMRAALAGGDRAGLRRLAHRLSGSFGVFGFRWAAARAKEVENVAVEGDPETLGKKILDIETHLDGAQVRVREAASA
jgi:PAS domain S-box-containing protein